MKHFKKTPISSGTTLLCAGALLAMSLAAQAQETQQLQRVEVTGTNIKRVAAETASPVQLITAMDIAKSGKATVAEYLQTLGVDGAGSLPTGFGNGFAAGSTAISLRGLGATSTLVLLNGRRMAAFGRADDGQKTFTDLSTMPMELVERIEILKDGASSVYGADAIAGVVNIITRKDFQGVTGQASTGFSRYGDMQQHKASITAGFGDLMKDGHNYTFNFEVSHSEALANSDRASRAWIGKGDLRPWGYAINTQFASGYITGNNNAAASPAGSIRDPKTLDYVSLPGCSSLSNASPQDPKGGCLWHQDQFRSMQPAIDAVNLFAGGTWKINDDLQAYAEAGYSSRQTSFMMTPPSITPTVAFPPNAGNPSGVINYGSGAGTTIVLAANHPQNPYGVPVRVRYAAFDVGPQERKADNGFSRFVAGLKGSAWGWDFDTAFVHSESQLALDYSAMLNMNVLKDALGNPNSKYFPYYIGAEASKNPQSLYDAMVRHSTADISTKLDMIDIKGSRELMNLPGGALSLAVGGEYRRESLDAPSLSGTEDGSVNASYVAAKGSNTVKAVYAELLAPVFKELEISAAIRHDAYDKFSSNTPKLGVKWTPLKSLAVRGTYAEGFRAPGAAEAGSESQSTGSSAVRDPVRCPGGTPAAGGATTGDCQITIAAVKVGNPNLQPEKSKGGTLGLVWDLPTNTSLAVDVWQIKRSNEINPMAYAEAAALPTAIRADNNLVVNGVVQPNTGTLLISKAPYRNSSYTQVKGVDIDLKQRIALGEAGRLTVGINWTHLNTWKRVEPDTVNAAGTVVKGAQYEYVGTHGNCDTSNCAGTPRDKVNFSTTWDRGDWSVTGNINYRSAMENRYFKGDGCASKLADGSDAPNGCRLSSFATLDLSVRYQASKRLQVFGSIQNATDRVAPLDPLTYGGMSYNPLDASGATGRYFKIGAKYQFM
ncbi:TonB-dependent receptor [Roseateles flavus]|uniref:TonB-dependent receptor n=1 Tax=Roseateles flavus TaxID=3149041 RepID=A0ABV0G9P2_9BURK